jgi:hypothetical protein
VKYRVHAAYGSILCSGVSVNLTPLWELASRSRWRRFRREWLSKKSKREAPVHYFGLPSVLRLKFCFSFVNSLRLKKLLASRTCDPYGVTVSGRETTASSCSVLASATSFSRRDCSSFNP